MRAGLLSAARHSVIHVAGHGNRSRVLFEPMGALLTYMHSQSMLNAVACTLRVTSPRYSRMVAEQTRSGLRS